MLLKFLERPKINITCQIIIFAFLSLLLNISTMSALKKPKDTWAGISSCLCLQVFLIHYHKMTLSLKAHKNVAWLKEWKFAEGKWSFGLGGFFCGWFGFGFVLLGIFFFFQVWTEICKQNWALQLIRNSNASFSPTGINAKQMSHELLLVFHIKTLKSRFPLEMGEVLQKQSMFAVTVPVLHWIDTSRLG